MKALTGLIVASAISFITSRADAQNSPAPTPADAYFVGAWACTGVPSDANAPALQGELTVQPWKAWYLAEWTAAVETHPGIVGWPEHGGHGPVVKPPQPPLGPNPGRDPDVAAPSVIAFFGYDPVQKELVAFNFAAEGPYSQMVSSGWSGDNTLIWTGAVSAMNGKSATVRVTNKRTDADATTFTTTYEMSEDMGGTWEQLAVSSCTKKTVVPPLADLIGGRPHTPAHGH